MIRVYSLPDGTFSSDEEEEDDDEDEDDEEEEGDVLPTIAEDDSAFCGFTHNSNNIL